MTKDEIKPVYSRDSLAILGAIGISGMVRINCLSKDINVDKDNEKALRRTGKSVDTDKITSIGDLRK